VLALEYTFYIVVILSLRKYNCSLWHHGYGTSFQILWTWSFWQTFYRKIREFSGFFNTNLTELLLTMGGVYEGICRLWLITWHVGLFIVLTLGQIGFKGRKDGYWSVLLWVVFSTHLFSVFALEESRTLTSDFVSLRNCVSLWCEWFQIGILEFFVIVIGVLSLCCHSSVWHIANHDIYLFAGKVKRVQVVGVKSSSCLATVEHQTGCC
jgi:hypothetical protein